MPLGTLPAQADEWETEVSQIAAEDEEISEYIRALEEREEEDEPLKPASGESIAAEFERYLRRRGPVPVRRAAAPDEPGMGTGRDRLRRSQSPSLAGGRTHWAGSTGCRHTDEVEIRPTEDRLPGLIFGTVPEGKTIKNRLHLDFRPDDRDAEVDRLLALGASRVDVGQSERALGGAGRPGGQRVLRAEFPPRSGGLVLRCGLVLIGPLGTGLVRIGSDVQTSASSSSLTGTPR